MLMSAKATLMSVNTTVQIQMGHMSVIVGMAIDLELIIIHAQVSQWMPHIIVILDAQLRYQLLKGNQLEGACNCSHIANGL